MKIGQDLDLEGIDEALRSQPIHRCQFCIPLECSMFRINAILEMVILKQLFKKADLNAQEGLAQSSDLIVSGRGFLSCELDVRLISSLINSVQIHLSWDLSSNDCFESLKLLSRNIDH